MNKLAVVFLILVACPSLCHGQVDSQEPTDDDLKQVVIEAFTATHDGWSSDEVILQSELNDRFVAECQKVIPDAAPQELNWTLMNLRKAGKLQTRATRRDSRSAEEVRPISEMCARMLIDKHGTTIDRIMTDPVLRAEFDEAALSIDEEVETYLVRKAAFQLRKIRRLRPELITRIADWGRVVTEFKAAELAKNPDQIPETPGIYIFRDASGYLYIGEAVNLRERLKQHLTESDRAALANYLGEQGGEEIVVETHTFEADSRIGEIMVRRAYESELIRSRNPRFNIRP